MTHPSGSTADRVRIAPGDEEYVGAMRRTSFVALALILLVAAVVALGYWQAQPPRVRVQAGQLSVESGFFDATIALSDVQEIALISRLPPIGEKEAGYQFGRAYRGQFASAGDSSVLLYVTAGAPPYLSIRTSRRSLIVNLADTSATRALYAALLEQLAAP